jgi:hypothetical protein
MYTFWQTLHLEQISWWPSGWPPEKPADALTRAAAATTEAPFAPPRRSLRRLAVSQIG